MAISSELKEIKKIYGESFMHLCRELFPTILEHEGKLLEILSSTFSDNCIDLCETLEENDLVGEFQNLIYSKIDVEKSNLESKTETETTKTPYEILDEAGYELFECKTEEEIQRFKKYYAPGEALCTFNGGRLNRCEVFFAVRKDVEQIKSENFSSPKREDEYGTSVMGIQFNREGRCTVSIKNRYNHTVNNPDATYGNDLDRIAPGLEKAFEELLLSRGLALNNVAEELSIPGYVVAPDGKYYKYNLEKDGIYYCPKNIVIYAGEVETVGDPEKIILIDSFFLDLENKKISELDSVFNFRPDSFVDAFENIERIEIKKDKNAKTRLIYVYTTGDEKPAIITIDKANQIIGYENENITSIADRFMMANRTLTRISVPNLQQVGDDFLPSNRSLTEFSAPNLQQVGDDFLHSNSSLKKFSAPSLQQVGDYFLFSNRSLTEFSAPNLQQAGNDFLYNNRNLTEFSAPSLQQVGNNFLHSNSRLKKFSAPNLQQVGDRFLSSNETLTEFSASNLEVVGDYFLSSNKTLTEFSAPKLEVVGDDFLRYNETLTEFSVPNLREIGDWFLDVNRTLTKFSAPKLEVVGDDFLPFNGTLTEFSAPNLQQVGDRFLSSNETLTEFSAPNLREIGNGFLRCNKTLTKFSAPNLQQVGNNFLGENPMSIKILDEVEFRKLQKSTITLEEIVNLDKETKLTSKEISSTEKFLETTKEVEKGDENDK